MLASSGNGIEGHILEDARIAAEPLERRDRGDFVEPAGRRLHIEPVQEARHGDAVAAVGGAGSLPLGRILARFRQHAGILALDDLRAA
jgi:hypothetical protein